MLPYRWNFFRYIYFLPDDLGSRQRTLLVHLFHLITQICCLFDQGNQAILDRKVDVCALIYFFCERALSLNKQFVSTTNVNADAFMGLPMLPAYGFGGLGVRLTFWMIRL